MTGTYGVTLSKKFQVRRDYLLNCVGRKGKLRLHLLRGYGCMLAVQ